MYDSYTGSEGPVSFIKINKTMLQNKTTLVLGASLKPHRYSNLAIKKLVAYKHPVFAIGLKSGSIENVVIETEKKLFEAIDTVTLYLNEEHQKEYYEYIFSLHPKRIIFNPGAENKELATLAQQKRIQPLNACTLVMLSTGQY